MSRLNSTDRLTDGRVELTEKADDDDIDLDEEEGDEWKQNFKKNFTASQIHRQTTLSLVSNVNMCYMILIGLTDLFKRRCEGRMFLK
mmetsp:Transcript_23875/g.36559  ORF Transcript_23875/g.36559 Transcript_23875/m.36559 type:complete len:87 (+) Transcript_23875:807-1067(+)